MADGSAAGLVNASDLDAAVRTFLNEHLSSQRATALEFYRLADALTDKGRQDLHDQVIRAVPVDRLSEWRDRRNHKRIGVGLSFCAAMHHHRQVYTDLELEGIPARYTSSKVGGREFAKAVGLRVAERYIERAKIDDIIPRAGAVLKPANDSGSRGVYLCQDDGTFFSVRDKTTFTDFAEVVQIIKSQMKSKEILSHRFHLEEMIVEVDGAPARDFKFYAFYGEIGLVIEIVRKPETRHCFYVNGKPANVGKYPGELFKGTEIPKGLSEEIQAVSRELPVPFTRIDVYKSKNGVVFGEFTHTPGNFEGFSLEHDRRLGEMYTRAQARLAADMFAGKRFEAFRKAAPAGTAS
ncbi:ATP-grasp fold amidoligase family protein [Brevundimonas naejangsanensis]|uniref:ATP-grasp fold amidoligase family protein n=1 Tax=Brevundimonas naejangsanensis TaxID=588932 RepID=UPI0004628F86|nr:ATP-grasp fold amidoligase family protein [Brevundimonas naejangsanensis]